MIDFKIIKEEFRRNNDILKTADFTALKVNYRDIKRLIDDGKIERIKNGYYQLADNDKNEVELIAGLFPDGVICMDSALFYYGYSDKIPLDWHIAVNKHTSKSRFNLDYPYIKPYYVEPEILKIGVTIADYGKCCMKIYDRDRLICDCLKYENKLDRETFNKAIQSYVVDPKKNISKLMEYAKIRGVVKKVHNIIGVWL